MPYEDDEDWVGEPPEGRYSADRARPAFWLTQRPPQLIAAAVLVAIIVVVVLIVAG